MRKLKIEMVHDIVCSWCPIGYRNIQRALRNLRLDADFYFLPFELNPEMDAKGESINEHLARRYQWDKKRLTEYRQHLLSEANKAGVTMDFNKRPHYFNSHQAHTLIHVSEGYGKQQAMHELLMEAYFEHGFDISNIHVLLVLAAQLGIDTAKVKQALDSDVVEKQMKIKRERVYQLQLQSVPAFMINEHTLLTGSNSVDYFEQALKELSISSNHKIA